MGRGKQLERVILWRRLGEILTEWLAKRGARDGLRTGGMGFNLGLGFTEEEEEEEDSDDSDGEDDDESILRGSNGGVAHLIINTERSSHTATTVQATNPLKRGQTEKPKLGLSPLDLQSPIAHQ